jgi:hypothetical protein
VLRGAVQARLCVKDNGGPGAENSTYAQAVAHHDHGQPRVLAQVADVRLSRLVDSVVENVNGIVYEMR